MTYLVSFDGADLSETALVKARVHAIALDGAPADVRNPILGERPLDVVAVSIVPESARYTREKGWIRADEAFSTE